MPSYGIDPTTGEYLPMAIIEQRQAAAKATPAAAAPAATTAPASAPVAGGYYGPGRTPDETLLRNKGYGGDLNSSSGIDAWKTASYGSATAPITSTTAPAPGSDQRAAYDAQQAAAASAARQASNQQIWADLGYQGPTGQGQGTDYAVRNNLTNDLIAKRQAVDPTFNANDVLNYKSPAKMARDNTLNTAQSDLQTRGISIDPDIQSALDRSIDSIYKTIPYGASDVSGYFTPDLLDNTLNSVQTSRRDKYARDFSSLIPDDYGTSAFKTTDDDDIIGKLLDEQYGNAKGLLDNNMKRGTLTDTGYQGGLTTLGQQRQAANSKLQTTGEDLLSTYRGDVNDILSSGRTAASNYKIGGAAFDPNSYKTKADTRVGELRNRLGDDLRSRVGDEQFFDVGKAMNSGFQAQGPQNVGRQAVLDTLASNEQKRKSQRGVGSQGAF